MIAKLNYYFKILTALTLTVAAGLAALLMASAPALGQDDYYSDPGTSPYDQETGVHRDTNVSMIFWGALDPTTVNTDTFKLVKQGTTTPVTATVTYYNWCEYSTEWMWYSCAAVLDPQADLEAGTTYTATVKGGENGVKWASYYGGTPTRSEDYSWSFTTSDDIQAPSPPTITSPQNNTSVSVGPFSVSGSAEASSTVELFEGTTSKGTTEADSSSTGAWSIDLRGVSIGTHTYYAKATDAAGNTSSSSDSVTVSVEDKTSPTVKSVYPNNGATGVVRNTDFAATFSEEMDPKTLITTPTDPADPTRGTSTTVTLVKEGTTTPISAKVMYTEYWNDHRIILSPPYPDGFYLDANTKYTVKIKGGSNGVKDLAGNQLGGGNQTSGDYWWSFTTGNVPEPTSKPGKRR